MNTITIPIPFMYAVLLALMLCVIVAYYVGKRRGEDHEWLLIPTHDTKLSRMLLRQGEDSMELQIARAIRRSAGAGRNWPRIREAVDNEERLRMKIDLTNAMAHMVAAPNRLRVMAHQAQHRGHQQYRDSIKPKHPTHEWDKEQADGLNYLGYAVECGELPVHAAAAAGALGVMAWAIVEECRSEDSRRIPFSPIDTSVPSNPPTGLVAESLRTPMADDIDRHIRG